MVGCTTAGEIGPLAYCDHSLSGASFSGESFAAVTGLLDHHHRGGDEVLKAFSALLKKNCGRSDIPCRYRGEEFLVVLVNTKEGEALRRAERCRRVFSATPFTFESSAIRVTASFGVASYPADGKNLGCADRGG